MLETIDKLRPSLVRQSTVGSTLTTNIPIKAKPVSGPVSNGNASSQPRKYIQIGTG